MTKVLGDQWLKQVLRKYWNIEIARKKDSLFVNGPEVALGSQKQLEKDGFSKIIIQSYHDWIFCAGISIL